MQQLQFPLDTVSQEIIRNTLKSGPFPVHGHENVADGGQLDEDALALTDVTTNNSSTTKHGFLKKLDNDSTHYMGGDGNWTLLPIYAFNIFKDFPSSSGFTENDGSGGSSILHTNAKTIVILKGDGDGIEFVYGNVPSLLTYQKLKVFKGWGAFSWNTNQLANANQFDMFFGIGTPYDFGALAFDYTKKHIGFRITKNGGNAGVVYITNADGSTQTQTDVTTTWALDTNGDPNLIDAFSFRIEIGTSSIAFYVNETLLGTHTTNIPTGAPAALLQIAGDNIAGGWAANQGQINLDYIIYSHTF